MTPTEIVPTTARQSSLDIWALYQRALPDPVRPSAFHRLLAKGKAQGLCYADALQYVIDHSPETCQ